MRQLYCTTGIAFSALFLAMACLFASSSADEVIIEEGLSRANIAIGDYSCSPCLSKLVAASFEMKGDQNLGTVELTAGELWQFFNDNGYDSVNTMTLFLDVDQISSEDSFNLSKLNVQIQSPIGGNLLTDTNLGAHQIIVPGYETSSSRPEAELKFDLGYDFMKLFTPESTELVRVSINTPVDGALAPTFHLTANDGVFGQTNLGQMFMFVLFWGAVFLVLLRWMKPVRTAIPVRPVTARPIAVRQRTA
ncbi:hypothetical protein [Mariniblastus fucicola]|uniref:Uncharacterized protein n=1 Tax=Mariniblastus fucicola TaxID=980251 RepID=A0A5B9PA61_9BACT|nr:hypothetical protein [Mariniblastus fucicola]QEG21820.1 hypothetical protein MFFC18_16800 [Mariniblastus fucicola]